MFHLIVLLIGLDPSFGANWKDLVRAQTPIELMQMDSHMVNSFQDQELCQQEAQSKAFPLGCIHWMQSMLESPERGHQFVRWSKRVNPWCIERAHLLTDKKTVAGLVALEFLDGNCHLALSERLADLNYIQGASVGPNIELSVGDEEDSSATSLL